MLRGHDARRALPSLSACSGWRQSIRSIRLALALLAICTALAGCSQTATARHATGSGAARGAKRSIPSPTPAPTATPNVVALRNDALGCAKGPPHPASAVVYTGKRPGTLGAAPNEVALTFDDGPTPSTSPPILSFLEQSHTPATFFVEGQYASAWPDLVEREWNDGFAIGVHTWDHPMMSTLTIAAMEHQFGDTLKAIHSAIGRNACVWLWRPPYADYNATVLAEAAKYGLTTVTWDDNSNDWTLPGVAQIVKNILSQAHPGAIVLMHDGPAQREQTAAALPLILKGLAQRGLVPVTLPKLLSDGQYQGVSVSAGGSLSAGHLGFRVTKSTTGACWV